MSRKFPNVEFVLAGDGPLRSELERQALELGLQGRVQFLGDRRDITAVLASMKCLSGAVCFGKSIQCHAGIHGGWRAGRSDRRGGNSELGGGGRALLVSPNSEGKLEAGLERVLGQPALRSSMADRAREFAQTTFSAEQICRRYRELYATALAKGRGRPQTGLKKTAGSRIRIHCRPKFAIGRGTGGAGGFVIAQLERRSGG